MTFFLGSGSQKGGKRGKTIKTPKRRTPGRKRTPSSARKLQALKTGPSLTRETSKRALFQSPPKENPKPKFTQGIASRVERSKRVLFSPFSSIQGDRLRSPDKRQFPMSSKRKHEDDSETEAEDRGRASKEQRIGSGNVENLTPGSIKFAAKSQSFCVTTTTTQHPEFNNDSSFFRATSEATLGSSQQLSYLHRQVCNTFRSIYSRCNVYFVIRKFSGLWQHRWRRKTYLRNTKHSSNMRPYWLKW